MSDWREFEAISPFSLERCLSRLNAEDGGLLRMVNAGSRVVAKVETHWVNHTQAAFRVEEIWRLTIPPKREPVYERTSGHSITGMLEDRQDNTTHIYGSTSIDLLWYVKYYKTRLILSSVFVGMVSLAASQYSTTLPLLLGISVFTGLLLLSVVRVRAYRVSLRTHLLALLHSSPTGR